MPLNMKISCKGWKNKMCIDLILAISKYTFDSIVLPVYRVHLALSSPSTEFS